MSAIENRACGARLVLTGGLGLLLALGGLGCGGDDDDSCEFSPCGGAVTGTWQIQDVCLTGNPGALFEGCMGASVDVGGLNLTGSLTLGADMSFSRTSTISGSMAFSLPSACLTVNNITLTCAQLDMALKADFAGDPDFSSVSCGDASGGCRCTAAFRTDSEMENGTYTVQGNVLSLRETGDPETETFEYCVSSDTLKLHSSGMAPMGEAVGGLIVHTKQ